jgi:hypothetical protein
VVDALLRAPADTAPKAVLREQVRAPAAPKGADTAMVDALVDPSKAVAPSAPARKPEPSPEVRKDASGGGPDQGVIDSLLGGGDRPDGGAKK